MREQAINNKFKGFLYLHLGSGPTGYSQERPFALISDRRCWGPNGVVRMGVAGWRFARVKRTVIGRPAVIAVLEKLPLICPLVLATVSLLMIGIALYRDLQ